MDEIKLLDKEGGLYVVNGRLVQIRSNAIDFSVPEQRAEAVKLADNMHLGKRGMVYGPYTVLQIYPKQNGVIGMKHLVARIAPSWLSYDLRLVLRKEFPDDANQF